MKIGVISDSHDNCPAIDDAVRLLTEGGAEHLVHAGDIVAPFAARHVAAFGGPVSAVFGNCDGERHGLARAIADIAPQPRTLEIGGRRILLVHDRARVEPDSLEGVDLLIFGHDHHARVVEPEGGGGGGGGGPVELNPGELGGWLTGKSTIALVELETLEIEIVEL